MSSTETIIIDIIARTCCVDRERILPGSTLKDLNVRSLDAVQVLFEIEDRFDVDVPERDAAYAGGTVRQLIDGIDRLIAAKTAVG